MAAQGALPRGRGELPDTGAVLTRQAADQLRNVLAGLGKRLAPAPVQDATSLTALVDALKALSERLETLELESTGRAQQLSETVGQLAKRLSDDAIRQTAAAAREADRDARLVSRLDRISDQLEQLSLDRDPWPIRALLAASCVAAALSVMSAAMLVVDTRARRSDAVASLPVLRPNLGLRPAIRVDAKAATRGSNAAVGVPSRPTTQRESYDAVVAALDRGETTALARLTGLAEAGDSQAQLNLADIYETGRFGLARDIPTARLWTRRAAEGGERVAMHNLALFLTQGDGGSQDFAEAAIWFRRAADRGVVDSQHNLGLLYEAGRGVDRNLREAYRWFTVAANAGDGASREKAVELETRLNANERALIEQSAATFQPGLSVVLDTGLVVPPAATVSETQALLARKGYFVGPVDGVVSPGFKAAVSAYRRDYPDAAATPQR